MGEAGRPFLRGLRAFLGLLQDEGDDAFELHGAVAQADAAAHAQRLVQAVEQRRQHRVLHLLNGRVQVVSEALQHGLHLLEHPVALVAAERDNGALADALAAVGHDPVQRHLRHLAQAAAPGAGTVGAVEAEEVGLRLLVGDAAGGAHEVAAQEPRRVLALGLHHHEAALAVLHRGLDGLGQPLAAAFAHLDAVHHQLDVVHLVAVEPGAAREVEHLAIGAGPQEALAQQLLEELAVVALAAAHERRQDEHLLAGVGLGHQLHDLLVGVAYHGLAGDVRVGIGHARIEQAQQVVDLRHRAHGAARVAADRLLLDGDHGAEPGDQVHVGPLDAAEELAGIGIEGLDVAPLPLGVDRIEGQGALAAAAEPGDHHQLVARYAHIDVLQVVHPGTEHLDVVVGRAFLAGGGLQGFSLQGSAGASWKPSPGSSRV